MVSSTAVTSTVNTFVPGRKSVAPVTTYVAAASLVATNTSTEVVSGSNSTSPLVYSTPLIVIVAPVSFEPLDATSKLIS